MKVDINTIAGLIFNRLTELNQELHVHKSPKSESLYLEEIHGTYRIRLSHHFNDNKTNSDFEFVANLSSPRIIRNNNIYYQLSDNGVNAFINDAKYLFQTVKTEEISKNLGPWYVREVHTGLFLMAKSLNYESKTQEIVDLLCQYKPYQGENKYTLHALACRLQKKKATFDGLKSKKGIKKYIRKIGAMSQYFQIEHCNLNDIPSSDQ